MGSLVWFVGCECLLALQLRFFFVFFHFLSFQRIFNTPFQPFLSQRRRIYIDHRNPRLGLRLKVRFSTNKHNWGAQPPVT